MYLIDTNVWLHRLLDHDHAQDVKELLDHVAPSELLISDFTLHSLGVILDRLGRRDVFVEFVRDVLIEGGVEVLSIGAERMERLVACMVDEGLDFDDAYQYVAAEDYPADLVSYDQDFDATTRGRTTPADVLAQLRRQLEEQPSTEGEPTETETGEDLAERQRTSPTALGRFATLEPEPTSEDPKPQPASQRDEEPSSDYPDSEGSR